MTQLNIWVAFEFRTFTIQCPERYRCSLLRSFADWTNKTRLPCLHSLSNSVCQGPVCSSYMVFSMSFLACATWRGALAISDMSPNNCDRMESRWDLYPLIWRIQKRRQRCRRRLLKSTTSQCEWVCAWACAFATLPLHSSPLWEGWSPGVSLHQLLGEQALVIGANDGSCFDVNSEVFFPEDCPFWLSSGLYQCCEVSTHDNACRKNMKKHMEAIATLHIRCSNLVPCKFEIQFKSYRVIVMKCCPPDLRKFSL